MSNPCSRAEEIDHREGFDGSSLRGDSILQHSKHTAADKCVISKGKIRVVFYVTWVEEIDLQRDFDCLGCVLRGRGHSVPKGSNKAASQIKESMHEQFIVVLLLIPSRTLMNIFCVTTQLCSTPAVQLP